MHLLHQRVKQVMLKTNRMTAISCATSPPFLCQKYLTNDTNETYSCEVVLTTGCHIHVPSGSCTPLPAQCVPWPQASYACPDGLNALKPCNTLRSGWFSCTPLSTTATATEAAGLTTLAGSVNIAYSSSNSKGFDCIANVCEMLCTHKHVPDV